MKKLMFIVLVFCVFAFMAPSYAVVFKLIDNFENNADLKNPEWWRFGNITASVTKNPTPRPGDKLALRCGKFSLNIKGSAKDWYCGGMGTYLGMDASQYTDLELYVYGYGQDSGTFRVELYDDDKGSWETQVDKDYKPVKDDMWEYEQRVDWNGWKQVRIPLPYFKLVKGSHGDGKMNLDQSNGSGGLLQMQFIFTATSKDGEVNMNLDNINMAVRERIDTDY